MAPVGFASMIGGCSRSRCVVALRCSLPRKAAQSNRSLSVSPSGERRFAARSGDIRVVKADRGAEYIQFSGHGDTSAR